MCGHTRQITIGAIIQGHSEPCARLVIHCARRHDAATRVADVVPATAYPLPKAPAPGKRRYLSGDGGVLPGPSGAAGGRLQNISGDPYNEGRCHQARRLSWRSALDFNVPAPTICRDRYRHGIRLPGVSADKGLLLCASYAVDTYCRCPNFYERG